MTSENVLGLELDPGYLNLHNLHDFGKTVVARSAMLRPGLPTGPLSRPKVSSAF
jgi:hypothetical protein